MDSEVTYAFTAIIVWPQASITHAAKSRDDLPDSFLATKDPYFPRL